MKGKCRGPCNEKAAPGTPTFYRDDAQSPGNGPALCCQGPGSPGQGVQAVPKLCLAVPLLPCALATVVSGTEDAGAPDVLQAGRWGADPESDMAPSLRVHSVAERLMTIAYESGVNLFDTAEVYAAGKAEVILGSIIKKKGWRRSSLVITTKLYWGGKAETERGLSRKHIIEGLKGSLQRLQLEYVDVVFANRPDSNTPMEEIVRAMTHVINQGMAMYWGTSRWSAMEIMEAYSVARQFNMIPPVCEQAEYHLFQREKVEVQLPELYHKIGVGAMTWSPLACGIISGKYGNGVPESSRASLKCYQWLKERIVSEEGRKQQNKLKDLSPIAERLGCTLPQLAVAWCLRNEGVSSVLLGSSTPEQLIENLGAIQVLPKMTSHVVNEIDNILRNKPYSKKDYRS
ncbi:Hypothetical predicted protein [Marmota monax]|uniref:Voltage-gated potassium channel subunit beta-1 n=1 Tax=Marmota monax TaxID=9995 RepID=A0A5E4BSU9_MARMO|nr:voltage-gated potassium channel subunit beta-1 [Marmota monax]VTJ72693.1 Hypothetical predicted protein [Marmota monax]